MNIEQLKNKINQYVETTIEEYMKSKMNVLLQRVSDDYNISYEELYNIYTSIYNEQIIDNTLCQAITKSGTRCSHKCIKNDIYCKKHIKNDNCEYVSSYFPSTS